jgi:gamma-glutamyltranspeptidase/glutathione hydrolase
MMVVMAGVLLIGSSCDSLKVTKLYERGIVVTVSPDAGKVGRDVLYRGGNAMDAAVAVGFALAVTYPQAGNIGGGGFAVVRSGADGQIRTLDFRETAPAAATEGMYLDADGNALDSLSTRGALAAGVPGSVAGLYALWEEYGSLPWSELVTTAARLADTGFVVDAFLSRTIDAYRQEVSEFEGTRQQFLPHGRVPEVGEKLVQADLARTLYMIAAEGPTAFYSGEIADSIVACMNSYGGIITNDDLESYQVVWREPLHFVFDSLDVYCMPPPSSGGIVLGQILGLLEPYDFSRYSPESPEYIHLFCEAGRLAFADRSEHLGDPAFYDIPNGLLDRQYLDGRREKISLDHAGNSAEIQPGQPVGHEPGETTHFSICDREGNMVAFSTTLNTNFGSGLVVSGAGFLLNSEMDDFAVKPGHPNNWDLVGAEANKIEPGKRMLSSMTPTLVLQNGQPYLILGSPGGSKIITTVAQAIISLTRFDRSLEETVTQPRFHHQWLPDQIYLEEGAYGVGTIQRLIQYGHQIKERTPFGDLEIVHIGDYGLMSGASDPRRGGVVAGCDSPTID